jgi:ABC-type glycerol-3-phosphate transport system substrate-binding protein
MTQRRALLALLALLAALLLVAAGCGGSSDEGSDEAAVETTTETNGDEEEMEEEGETTEDETETGGLSAFANEDCQELASIGASIAQAVDPSGTFDADEAAQLYEQLAEKAPDEIQDDLAVFADYMAQVAEALSGVDLTSGQQPSAEDLQALQALSNIGPEVEQAAENLSAWASENCSVGG